MLPNTAFLLSLRPLLCLDIEGTKSISGGHFRSSSRSPSSVLPSSSLSSELSRSMKDSRLSKNSAGTCSSLCSSVPECSKGSTASTSVLCSCDACACSCSWGGGGFKRGLTQEALIRGQWGGSALLLRSQPRTPARWSLCDLHTTITAAR
jgi:hypothetical protein